MSDRVVDESNPDNYLSSKDVHSLWAEEDLLKEIPIEPWDIQGCVQKCNKLGDVVRILIKFLLLLRDQPFKGQIISECPYEKIVCPKIATKKFPKFLPWPLRRGQTKNFIKPIMLNNP